MLHKLHLCLSYEQSCCAHVSVPACRGQDSAGMVTTDWAKFREYKDNGLVKDVFTKKSTMDKLQGGLAAAAPACGSCSLMRSQLASWLAQA